MSPFSNFWSNLGLQIYKYVNLVLLINQLFFNLFEVSNTFLDSIFSYLR